MDHLGLVFRDFHINLSDLEDYCRYVNFGQGPNLVPKYPLPKEDHLNFLKPGSKEVVTRPVHIHEHLPPMYPLLEGRFCESVLPEKIVEMGVFVADLKYFFAISRGLLNMSI